MAQVSEFQKDKYLCLLTEVFDSEHDKLKYIWKK